MAKSLTSSQVSALLGVSTKTLYAWERAGKIPKSGRDRRGWRTYTLPQVDAIRRFAGVVPPEAKASARGRKQLLGLTARNQIRGTIVAITADGLLAEVVLKLGDGQEIVAVVTRNSVERLGLKAGQTATAIIKATEVMLFT